MIRITSFYFNILLKVYYETFIEKLKQHKSTIEQNIKNYIRRITLDLSKGNSRINRFNQNIEKIKSQIPKFDENYREIGLISGYYTLRSIIQKHVKGNIGTIREIFLTLVDYRNDLREFDKHKVKLFNYISLLKSYSNDILKIETNHSGDFSYYTGTAHSTLKKLNDLNTYIGQLNNNIRYVKKLRDIGGYITTMKSKSNQVRDKLNHQFKKHIQNLTDIDFDYTEFQKSFTKIKNFNTLFIKKFNMANKSIELLKSIESGTSMLKEVNFSKYDIDELEKNSNEIRQKLKSLQAISFTSNVDTSDESVPEINQTHEQYSKDVSLYQSLISYLLDEISVVIYIHYLIQILILYSYKISEIPKKIKEMEDIDRALNTLPDIFKDLMIVYRVHKSSMNILIVFNFISFAKYYINKNVYNFILVNYYCEILIFSIYCYIIILSALKFLKDLLNHIISNRTNLISETREIKILRAFTTNTNQCLKSIQCDIETLKSTSDELSIKNVKDSLIKIRTFIKEISRDTNQVKNNIKFMIKGILKLYVINFKIIYIKTYVGETIKKVIRYIYYLYIYYLMFNISMAKRYTKKEKKLIFLIHLYSIIELKKNLIKIEKENEKDKVTYGLLIQFLMYNILLQRIQIEKLVNKIEKPVEIDKSVLEVECAIEGVPRNFMQCSLQSTNTSIVKVLNKNWDFDLDNQVYPLYSVINVTDYKVVVNRLFECSKKIDNTLKLVPWYDSCQCILMFESFNIKIELKQINVFDIINKMSSQPMNKFLGLDKIRQIHELGIGTNHSCLCMIVKYNMYPSIIKCIQTIGIDLTVLSTLSRKFTKYRLMESNTGDLIKILIFVINFVDKISTFIEHRYLWATSEVQMIPNLICFCRAPDDKYYHLILNMVLVISSILQNVWNMENQDIKMGIVCVSSLIREFEKITKDNTTIGWNNCKLFINKIVINKICCKKTAPPCQPECCCVTCLIIILMSIYICISLKIKEKLCPTKSSEIKDRLCCFLKLVCNSKNGDCQNLIKSCEKVFNLSIPDCCKKLLESCKEICPSTRNGDTNCNLDDWLKKCTELCNGLKVCSGDCICTEVKESVQNLCDSSQNSEFQKLLHCIENCCKTEGCKCCKCKIVSRLINVMTKNMVLIEYNLKYDIKFNSLTHGSRTRIALSKNIKSLYLCHNKLSITLVKNNQSSHGTGLDTNPTVSNTVIERNWGYDTQYEHDINTPNKIPRIL